MHTLSKIRVQSCGLKEQIILCYSSYEQSQASQALINNQGSSEARNCQSNPQPSSYFFFDLRRGLGLASGAEALPPCKLGSLAAISLASKNIIKSRTCEMMM